MATQLTKKPRTTTSARASSEEKDSRMTTVGLVLLIVLALAFTIMRHVSGN